MHSWNASNNLISYYMHILSSLTNFQRFATQSNFSVSWNQNNSALLLFRIRACSQISLLQYKWVKYSNIKSVQYNHRLLSLTLKQFYCSSIRWVPWVPWSKLMQFLVIRSHVLLWDYSNLLFPLTLKLLAMFPISSGCSAVPGVSQLSQ